MQGDYFVRAHDCPHTARFSPLGVLKTVPPPIGTTHLESPTHHKTQIFGQHWPTIELAKDCWTACPSDARPLLNPLGGKALTEPTHRPKPPPGKVWCCNGFVRARAGSRRDAGIHPPHWWLMSTPAPTLAAGSWTKRCWDQTGSINTGEKCYQKHPNPMTTTISTVRSQLEHLL